jgi:hypothetical protein
MGIPHLITYVRPYAKTKSLKGQNVVVDGPAFAYHIYHRCIALRPGARNPFDAVPTYKDIGEAAVLWLGELKSHGVTL